MNIKYSPLGDEHILIEFGDKISKEILMNVMACSDAVAPMVEEYKTAYTTVMVKYNPLEYEYSAFVKKLDDTIQNVDASSGFSPQTHIIKTQYSGEFGQDLKRVAKHNKLTEKQVVKLHTENIYTVYMIGFLPGFCYLGGLDKRLSTPRLEVPRKKIVKGSVGIAGEQTGVYPIASPGGWNIIGRTEFEFFKYDDPPCEVKPGDSIRFLEV